jgi:hypothetical protein
MLDTLRTPFLLLALVLLALGVLLAAGAGFVLEPRPASPQELAGLLGRVDLPSDGGVSVASLVALRRANPSPPGLALPHLALLDGLVLFALALVASTLVLSARLQGRLQGLASLIVAVLGLLAGLKLLLLAFGKLVLMAGLFLSPPFGTVTYLALYGFFDRPGAAVVLGLLLLLKVGAVVCLGLAHQRFLAIKRLMALLATSLLANVLIAFLHGLPPGILVSITDALGALIIDVLALVWAVVMLGTALVSVLKVLRVDRAA